MSNPLAPSELRVTLLVIGGGTLLALGLARRSLLGGAAADAGANAGPLRRAAVAVGVAFEEADLLVRRWPVASTSVVTLAAMFGGLLVVGART